MTRPHVAGVVEDGWNRALAGGLRRRGWRHLVVPHTGYAGPGFVRVLARVVLAPDSGFGGSRWDYRRGWRNFLTAEAVDVEVTVEIDGATHTTRTDRSGHVDVRLPDPGLRPGWAEVVVTAEGSEPVATPVLVVDPGQTFGLVSDIDDTVIRTSLPRPLLAAYNTLVVQEQSRRPVPGMASLYDAVLAEHPGAPTFYVSTGAWNTAPMLTRFLARHDFPAGPLMLTDWGPTNTGWFRSGQEHKHACLESLVADFPSIRWLLVGDDGQHDPEIYAAFARAHPDRVRAVALRELSATQQVLSHGTPTEKGDSAGAHPPPEVPEVRGPDGDAIAVELLPLVSAPDA
jgi:phosphatidate phosphatase APP1